MNLNLGEKIKNIGLGFREKKENKISYHRKKQIAIILLLLSIVIIVPLSTAHAVGTINLSCAPLNFVCWGLEWVLNQLVNILLLVIYWVGMVALYFVQYFVQFGAYLIDIVLQPVIYNSVFNSSAVLKGWTVVRDFCNMFFVFLLLLIAFSTILRIESYSWKRLLPKFLLALFLINFSMEITKLVIDFGQIFMYGIMGWMGTFSGPNGAGGGLSSVVNYFYHQVEATWNATNFGEFTAGHILRVWFAVGYSILLGVMYFIFVVLLVIRIVMLAILIILSPFAFFAITFPSIGKYLGSYWTSLIQYSLFGPIFMFFVYLSATIAMDLVMSTTVVAVPTGTTDGITGALSVFLATMIPHVIGLIMLLLVVPVTQKLGIAGTSMVMGGVGGVGTMMMAGYAGAKLAGGWGKKAVSAPASRGHAYLKGNSEKYKNFSGKVDKAMGKMPLGVGQTYIENKTKESANKRESVDAFKKIYKSRTPEQMKDHASGFNADRTKRAEAEQAMVETMLERGKTSNEDFKNAGFVKVDSFGKQIFDETKFAEALNRIQSHGGDVDDFIKKRPDFAGGGNKDEKIKELKKLVSSGKWKDMSLDTMNDKDIRKELNDGQLISKSDLRDWRNSKGQPEKDKYVEQRERDIAITGGALSNEDRVEFATLVSPSKKEERMMPVTSTAGGEIRYSGTVNVEIAQKVAAQMPKKQLLQLDEDYLKKYGHLFSASNVRHIAKNGEQEQSNAILEAIEQAKSTYTGGGTGGPRQNNINSAGAQIISDTDLDELKKIAKGAP